MLVDWEFVPAEQISALEKAALTGFLLDAGTDDRAEEDIDGPPHLIRTLRPIPGSVSD